MKTEMPVITDTVSNEEIARIIVNARRERSDWIVAALRGLFVRTRRSRLEALPGRPLAC
jgi:hypothetical protein